MGSHYTSPRANKRKADKVKICIINSESVDVSHNKNGKLYEIFFRKFHATSDTCLLP